MLKKWHPLCWNSTVMRLPLEKQRMLNELESILHRRDPALLRPEFMRGL